MRTVSMCSPGKVWELSTFPKKRGSQLLQQLLPTTSDHFLQSSKHPWLGVHTSCFVSYTAWANHSIKWLLITAAHHFFLSISLGAITHLTLLCFGVTWCLCPHPMSQERAEAVLQLGWGLTPSWPGFWGDWVNEVICWSVSHISYIFLTWAGDFIWVCISPDRAITNQSKDSN